jgi:hypothetical protein
VINLKFATIVGVIFHSKQLSQMLNAPWTNGGSTMKIERMSFIINPPFAAQEFVDMDKRMWDPWLRMRPGFIQKTVNTHPGGRVEIQIFWKNKESQNKAAQHPELPVIEATFRNALGPTYNLLYSD